MANSNTRIVLASHPSGEPTEADFRIETVPVPDPDDGQVLIRTIHLSLDGYIDRGSKSCTPRHQLSGTEKGWVFLCCRTEDAWEFTYIHAIKTERRPDPTVTLSFGD